MLRRGTDGGTRGLACMTLVVEPQKATPNGAGREARALAIPRAVHDRKYKRVTLLTHVGTARMILPGEPSNIRARE